jgi:hypothetical protein
MTLKNVSKKLICETKKLLYKYRDLFCEHKDICLSLYFISAGFAFHV